MTWPPSAAEVAAFGQITQAANNPPLADATAGAVAFVERERPDLYVLAVFSPDDDVRLGTLMLAVNYYERRGASAGEVRTFEQDEIDRLLRIGIYRPFGFGSPAATVDGTASGTQAGSASAIGAVA